MRPARSAWRVLHATVLVGLALAACSTDVAVYDPTIQRGGPLDGEQIFGSGTVVLDSGATDRIGEDEPTLRNRIPAFIAPGFDPELGALSQLDPEQGGMVTMLGPETGSSAESIQFALTAFTNATGTKVDYIGAADVDLLLDELIGSGTPPDVAILEQPSQITSLAQRGLLIPLPQIIQAQVEAGYDSFWRRLATVEERLFAVPQAGSVKSLVWYSPQVFSENGYTPPATFDELEALVDQIRSDGLIPWCVGLGSGASSGWPLSDWIEDYMLRFEGPDFYDRWVRNEVPFNDPKVVAVIERVTSTWFEPGNVNGGRSAISSTSWIDAAIDHLNGECVLHRQASNVVGTYRDAGADVGARRDINAFYLPTVTNDFGRVVLGARQFRRPR